MKPRFVCADAAGRVKAPSLDKLSIYPLCRARAVRNVLGAAGQLLNAYAAAHSDFTDPKGPLLTPDFHIPKGYQGEALLSE